MVKPEITRVGNSTVRKRFRDLEFGEWFVNPETGNLCVVEQLYPKLDIKSETVLDEVYRIDYHDHCENMFKQASGRTLDRDVALVKVAINYELLRVSTFPSRSEPDSA